MLKLECTLPSLANNCPHKSTDTDIFPFTQTNEDLLEKFRECVVRGPYILFTRKAVVDGTFFESLRTYLNQLLGMMLASYIHIRCVNPCPRVFIRVRI